MSIDAISWAFKQNVTPAAKKLVLIALADNADQYGICFPSYNHISEKTGLDRRTIMNNVKSLVDEGIILKAGRRRNNNSHSSNAYHLPLEGSKLDDHPLGDLFLGDGEEYTPPLVNIDHHPSERHDTPLTVNITKKKKTLTRCDFLREIDQARLEGKFGDFAHLTESEIKFCSDACWDFWNAKGEWPAGEGFYIVRNWIRGGIGKGKVRGHSTPEKSANGTPAALSSKEQEDLKHRLNVKSWMEKGFWHWSWGNAPDEEGCKVPEHIIKEFFPDGKIPALTENA